MRSARARPRGRPIVADGMLRRWRAVGPADRRGIVDIAERGAVGEVDRGLRGDDGLAHIAARAFTLRAVFRDLGMRRSPPVAHEISRRLLHDALGHRPALALVGVEQAASTPSLDHGGELPAEISGVAHAGVEAETAGGRVLMRGVAGEEDAAYPVAVRHQVARNPAQRRYHLVRHRLADHAGDELRSVQGLGVVEVGFAVERKTPQLAAVELNERAPNPLRIGEEMQRRLALVVLLPQRRRAKKDVEIVFERRIAVHLDAESLGDRAVAAAAGNETVGGDALALATRELAYGRDHAVIVLLEGFETAVEPHLHPGKAFGARAQDRIEPELVAALRPLRAHRAGRASAVAGTLDAGDFEAGERSEIEHRVRIILGRAGCAHWV